MINLEVRQKIAIPEAEVVKYFDEHTSEFRVEESFKIREIVLLAEGHTPQELVEMTAKVREELQEGLPFSEFDLLIVELADDHTLTSMCLYLLGAELSIRFAYPLMLRPNGRPTIALAVDDQTLAGQILRKKNFRLLGEGDLP